MHKFKIKIIEIGLNDNSAYRWILGHSGVSFQHPPDIAPLFRVESPAGF